MLKVPRFIVNNDSSSVLNTTLDTTLNSSLHSTLSSTYSTDKNEISDPSFSISNFLNPAAIPNFDLKFSTFVITDQESTASDADLVSKICKSIQRDVYSSLDLNDPKNNDILNLMNYINQSHETLGFQNYKKNFDFVKKNPSLKVIIYFSNEASSTEVFASDNIFENYKIIKIKTYSLEDIASDPNHKSEFWNILKELK